MAKDPKPVDPDKMSRRAQFVETYRMARKSDPRLPLWILGSLLVGGVIGFVVFWILPGEGVLGIVLSIVGALLVGTMLAMIVFGRRAQRAAYAQMEGQPGAAAAALRMLDVSHSIITGNLFAPGSKTPAVEVQRGSGNLFMSNLVRGTSAIDAASTQGAGGL